jgi:hypothetical protein
LWAGAWRLPGAPSMAGPITVPESTQMRGAGHRNRAPPAPIGHQTRSWPLSVSRARRSSSPA